MSCKLQVNKDNLAIFTNVHYCMIRVTALKQSPVYKTLTFFNIKLNAKFPMYHCPVSFSDFIIK